MKPKRGERTMRWFKRKYCTLSNAENFEANLFLFGVALLYVVAGFYAYVTYNMS